MAHWPWALQETWPSRSAPPAPALILSLCSKIIMKDRRIPSIAISQISTSHPNEAANENDS